MDAGAGGAALSGAGSADHRLADLVTRAGSLWARHGAPATDRDRGAADARVEARIARWQGVMGGSGPLANRLKPETLDALKATLAEPATAGAEAPMPAWASTLGQVLDAAQREKPGPGPDTIRGRARERALPFEEAFRPFLAVARDGLEDAAGPALAVLGPLARAALERQLTAHLSFVANLCLAEDFSQYRFQKAPASAFETLWQSSKPSTEIYDAYIAGLAAGGLARLFDTRPVLARLLSQSTGQWVAATAGLCKRFAEDFALLKRTFGFEDAGAEGAVRAVRTDLSDRHNGGQTVAELTLGSGYRIIYKPRSVEAEAVFNRILARLNAEGPSIPLRTIAVVDRGSHGWCEAVAPSACGSRDGVARFYRRAGMLLAVLHLLQTTDIHCENIIAAGEHPVVVDLETMLNAWAPADGTAPWSVLNTGLLPRRQTGPDGRPFDLSGLCADSIRDPAIGRRAWVSVNTDQMHLSDPVAVAGSTANRPRLGDALPEVRDYLEPLLDGFREMYGHLLRSRDQLLRETGILEMFDDLDLRVLVRGTAIYTGLQLRLLHPEFMASGIDRSIELEWLARPLSGLDKPNPDRTRVYEHERDAMERLDVPHFTTAFAKRIADDGGDSDLAFLCARRDGALVRGCLEGLSAADCRTQAKVIAEAIGVSGYS